MFQINNVVYDDYVVQGKYRMNRVAEYGGTEYRDGWWKRHRSIVRYVINGTVTLAFPTEELYNAFIDNLAESIGIEGDYRVRVYVEDLNELQTIRAFLTPVGKVAIATKTFNYRPVFFNVTIKVEER